MPGHSGILGSFLGQSKDLLFLVSESSHLPEDAKKTQALSLQLNSSQGYERF